MKYFFLTEDWIIGRVWGVNGLWDEVAWRRKPQIQAMNLCIVEQDEKLWLHGVENEVLMVEVLPGPNLVADSRPIGQVVLKRLMTPEQVLDLLCERAVFNPGLPVSQLQSMP